MGSDDHFTDSRELIDWSYTTYGLRDRWLRPFFSEQGGGGVVLMCTTLLFFQVVFQIIIKAARVSALDHLPDFIKQVLPDGDFTVYPQPEGNQALQIDIISVLFRHHAHNTLQNVQKWPFLFFNMDDIAWHDIPIIRTFRVKINK